jgi:hypothetical protein
MNLAAGSPNALTSLPESGSFMIVTHLLVLPHGRAYLGLQGYLHDALKSLALPFVAIAAELPWAVLCLSLSSTRQIPGPWELISGHWHCRWSLADNQFGSSSLSRVLSNSPHNQGTSKSLETTTESSACGTL